jgi:hypothetical protein
MSIYGNSYLTCLAYYANTPSQAAKFAELSGCDKQTIQNVREASKLIRDQGVEAFLDKYEPFERIDKSKLPKEYSEILIKVSINRLYEKRALNSAEINQINFKIASVLTDFGVTVEIEDVPSHSQIKSTFPK